jgi:hypothetical protein
MRRRAVGVQGLLRRSAAPRQGKQLLLQAETGAICQNPRKCELRMCKFTLSAAAEARHCRQQKSVKKKSRFRIESSTLLPVFKIGSLDPLASKLNPRSNPSVTLIRLQQQGPRWGPAGVSPLLPLPPPPLLPMRAAPARAVTDKKALLRCRTNAQAAVWSEKMPPMVKKLPKKPKGRGTPSPRLLSQSR